MRIKTRLVWAFGAVVLTTLLVSALGYIQTRELSSALYEIAVVRMPSVEALNGMEKAMTSLNRSNPASEDRDRNRDWLEFDRQWKAYEVLPQTPDETKAWQRFTIVAEEWRRQYQSGSASANTFVTATSLLDDVIAINNQIVADQKKRTIARFEDAQRAQRTMLAGGVIALFASVTIGFLFGRSITNRLHSITDSLNKVAKGNLDTQIPVGAEDELGEVARATNLMMIERKRAEAKVRAYSEQLRALAGRVEAVREEERIHIAREIHDVLAQDLTRLKFGIASIGRRITVGPIDYYPPTDTPAALSSVADSAIQTVQKIAAELRPIALDSLGLAAAIEWQAEEFQRRTGIQCDAILPDEEIQLDRLAATNVFRIVQESLTNINRHAAATRVEIILEQNPDSLLLIIQDNGKGFDPACMKDPNSLGLLGMRERAAMLQGSFRIVGTPKKGTEIRVSIPLAAQKHTDPEPAIEPAAQI